MLVKPASCEGCVLHDLGTGFMKPSLSSTHNGVALLGEALGADEAEEGSPFVGRAGFRLTRLIEWAGFKRSDFDIYNAVWCRPPNNLLAGEIYETRAVDHCRSAHWDRLLSRQRVVVPMGNVPTQALVGRRGILKLRGYVYPARGGSYHIIPTVHPSFIQRGQSKWSAAFIHDLQRAVELSRDGLRVSPVDYLIDPRPGDAYQWALEYRRQLDRAGSIPCRLAYDIETPGKGEDEGEVESDDEDRTYYIYRIGFSFRGHSALTVPWTPEYIPAIRLLLESEGEKVVWNAGFDNPRIRAAGVGINGLIHDGMVAWHILHSDLPKGLGFVATFTCPDQHEWKSLSHSRPGYYNCCDADVELRSMEVIEEELKKAGLWDVYERDVIRLDPILHYMTEQGMPIDQNIRLEKAIELDKRLKATMERMEGLVPEEARRVEHVYINEPADKSGLRCRPGTREVPHCPGCGLAKPRRDHFKSYVKKVNPCATLQPEIRTVIVEEYYRLADFTPSRDQLLRYQQRMGRPTPMKYDKKTQSKRPTMDERAIKGLLSRFPDDILYSKVLEYRELQKIAGTYIGYPI